MNEIDLGATDLNLLHVFDCIYREQSLTRAGVRLGRTQSAVSHALERLRVLFADPLFVRTAAEMRPTPRAVELAPRVDEALRAVRAVLREPASFDPAALDPRRTGVRARAPRRRSRASRSGPYRMSSH